MSLSTTQYGYIVDPMVPFTDEKGKTIKNGFIRVFMAGTSTPVITYRNYDGATNQEKIELDNSGRVMHNVIGSKGSLYKVVVYNILHSQENPLLTVDKIAVLGASINASGATIVTGLDSVTVPEDNFLKATVEGTGVELTLDPTEVTSEVSTIGAAETAAPDYVLPLLDKTGIGDGKKISLANLFKFALDWISRLATTVTSFASGDFIAVSNTTNGARKMSALKLLDLTTQNVLESGNTITKHCWMTSSIPQRLTNVGDSAYSIKFIYVEGVSTVKVSPQSGRTSVVRFLTALPEFEENAPLPLASTPGTSIDEETTFTLSSDTKYMLVGDIYSNVDFFPESITFDGLDFDDFSFSNLPKEIIDLSQKIGENENEIEDIDRRLGGNTITEHCWMTSSSPQRLTNVGDSAYSTKFIYVEGVSSVKVSPQSGRTSVVRFLTALPKFEENAPLPLASTPGTSVNVETTFTLSSDTKYMLVGEIYSNVDYFPESLTFDGLDYDVYRLDSYEKELESIKKHLQTDKVMFKKDSSTQFSLYKTLNNGKVAKFVWTRATWKSQDNGIEVVDNDCWIAKYIYVDGVEIAQCNINFIYLMTENEGGEDYAYFVGSGHGCCVENYVLFFIDGHRVDFSSISNGEELTGKEIRIVISANVWAASKARTIANGGNTDKVYAKVDSESNPILSTIWLLDYVFDASGEHYINQLTAKRNNTRFVQCYGAMNSTQPNEFDNLVENDQFGSRCSWVYENDEHVVTSISGQNLVSDLIKGISKATQYGSNYTLSVECENIIEPYKGHVRNWFEDGGTGRMKVYLNPIKTTQSDGANADVFGDGDIIRCRVERSLQ